jgi:hypothetical protein
MQAASDKIKSAYDWFIWKPKDSVNTGRVPASFWRTEQTHKRSGELVHVKNFESMLIGLYLGYVW